MFNKSDGKPTTPIEVSCISAVGIKRKLDNEGYTVKDWNHDVTKREIDEVTHHTGIYALYHGSTLQYIGLSKDLQRRIQEHRIEDLIPFGNFAWYDIHYKQLHEAKRMLIDYYDPRYNKS